MTCVKTGMQLVHRALMLKHIFLGPATLATVATRASHFVSARHDKACALRVRARALDSVIFR